MSWMQRWLRTTFQYNPSFPLSALLLLLGLVCLSEDGVVVAGAWLGPGVNLGILQSYEAILLGGLLFLLWPRKIVYESSSILIIFAIIRYAAPFIIIGMAGNQNIPAMLIFGLVLSAAMIWKTHLILTRVGLPSHLWERIYDSIAYILCALVFPFLGELLARQTGVLFSIQTGRIIQWASWWSLSGFLVVLCHGLPNLGSSKPLKSRRAAALWRGLSVFALPFLLGNALWVGGEAPVLAYLLPLPLAMVAVLRSLREAYGHTERNDVFWLPALLAGLILVTPERMLFGSLSVLGRGELFFLFAPIAALSSLVLAPRRTEEALKALTVVTFAAPILLCSDFFYQELYILFLSITLFAWGLRKSNDILVAASGVLSCGLLTHLVSPSEGVMLSCFLFTLSGLVSVFIGWRKVGPLSLAMAINGAGLAYIYAFHLSPVSVAPFCFSLFGVGGFAFLCWNYEIRWAAKAALALPFVLVGGHVPSISVTINYGYVFITLAFIAVPIGIAVALRREAEADLDDLEFDPGPEDLVEGLSR